MIGHSVGEIAAAYVAEALTLEEGCRLACVRGRVMGKCRGAGKMVSLEAPEEEIRELLKRHPGVSLAAVNGPTSTVVSGPRAVATLLSGVGR